MLKYVQKYVDAPLQKALKFDYSSDCGTTYTLEHGYASFDGMSVSFGATVPIRCVHGYEIGGPDHITCQANKTWTTSSCKIIGN